MGRRRRRRSSPPPDNTAQLVAEANEAARKDAEKARKDNLAQMQAMQAKADAERKKSEAIARTPGATKVGSTMASAEQGLGSAKQKRKKGRAKKASDLRIARVPAGSLIPGGDHQGQPTIG
mgnify:CR=1 FL=1